MISLDLPEIMYVISPETIQVLNESLKRYCILYFPHSQEILLNFYLQTLKETLKILLNFCLLCCSSISLEKKEKKYAQ